RHNLGPLVRSWKSLRPLRLMSLTRVRPRRDGFAATENGVVVSVCAARIALIVPTRRCESELECAGCRHNPDIGIMHGLYSDEVQSVVAELAPRSWTCPRPSQNRAVTDAARAAPR